MYIFPVYGLFKSIRIYIHVYFKLLKFSLIPNNKKKKNDNQANSLLIRNLAISINRYFSQKMRFFSFRLIIYNLHVI